MQSDPSHRGADAAAPLNSLFPIQSYHSEAPNDGEVNLLPLIASRNSVSLARLPLRGSTISLQRLGSMESHNGGKQLKKETSTPSLRKVCSKEVDSEVGDFHRLPSRTDSSGPVTIILSTANGGSLKVKKSWRRRRNRKIASGQHSDRPALRQSSEQADSGSIVPDSHHHHEALGRLEPQTCRNANAYSREPLQDNNSKGVQGAQEEVTAASTSDVTETNKTLSSVTRATAKVTPPPQLHSDAALPTVKQPWSSATSVQAAASDPQHQKSLSNCRYVLGQPPTIQKLAADLRENFNLSSFLFTTTPHLLRFVPVQASVSSAVVDVGLVGAVDRLGAAAAAAMRKPHLSGEKIPLAPDEQSPLENDLLETDVKKSVDSSELLDEHWLSSEDDLSDDSSHDDVIPSFNAERNIIDSSALTSLTRSDVTTVAGLTRDWFSQVGPDRQAALVGLLNGLGLTSHLFHVYMAPPAHAHLTSTETMDVSCNVSVDRSTAPMPARLPGYRYPPRLAFCLSYLWQAFEEASCYGVESPSVDLDDGTCSTLVFVPYLSALQLATVPSENNMVTFSYFENKPPHVRRPLSRQIERLAGGLEVPVSPAQRRLLLEASTDDLNKEESWLSIYWMPLQQKEASSSSPPPAFLVYYSFTATDDPLLARRPSGASTATESDGKPTCSRASPKLEGLMSATPQLVRFAVVPHRADLNSWGVHNTTIRDGTTDTIYRTTAPLKRVNHGLQEWLEAKRIIHPDYEFIRRRLKL